VNPVVAVALGVGLAGEHLTGLELLSMLVILLGVGLLGFKRSGSKRSLKAE